MGTGRSTFKGLGLISAFLVLGSIAAIGAVKNVKGTITKIVDGDTAWVEVAGKRLTIRVVGIDAPESHLPAPGVGVVGQGHWGDDAATKFAKLLPLGAKITLEDQGLDSYKRTLGRLILGGKDMNLEMVKSGWAIPYIICTGETCDENFFERENVQEYINACENAQAKGLGIFKKGDELEEMPFEFRLRMQKRLPDKWVGDFYTDKLYAPADYAEVELCSRIFFMKKKDAAAVGFEP